MEVPRFWRNKDSYLHLVFEKNGKLIMRGRECEWDGEQLHFVDERVYAPSPTEASNMLAVGMMGLVDVPAK